MNLRKLESKDAPLMLEWMHDPVVVSNLRADFNAMTINDCVEFINKAQEFGSNVHMAIVDDCDIYMGTVSLKHILDGTAEFAIAIRTTAMGKGFSKFGMQEIIRLGFEEKKLKKIYWCVDKKNKRACRFYDKNGYKRMDIKESGLLKVIHEEDYNLELIDKYLWYLVENTNTYNN